MSTIRLCAATDESSSVDAPLRAVVDATAALVWLAAPDGGAVYLGRRWLAHTGLTAEQALGWGWAAAVHRDDLERVTESYRTTVASGAALEIELRLRRFDGQYRVFLFCAAPLRDGSGAITGWCGTHLDIERSDGSRSYREGTDIRDRRSAEDKLRRNEAFLLEVQRLSHTGGWRFDLPSGVVESSPEIQRVYDVQPGEDISRPEFWFGRIHPEDRPGVEARFAQCLRDKEDYRASYRVVLPDGSIRFQHATGHLVVNDAGEIVEVIGAQMDMTEHWLATIELERASRAVRELQLKMSRAAQVASVGELAASIAHEVNQPLAAVVANGHACLRWLAASPPNVPKAVEALERLVKDGKDAGEVVRRIRALFKRGTSEKAPLDANEVILEVLRLLDGYPARRHVEVDTALDAGLPSLIADRVQLQQLVLNLLLNALEALEPVSGRARKLSVRSTRAEEGSISIQIADNGIGLDDPQAVFEAFYTTKPAGMGLGLAICRSIVTAHHGKLSAEPNVGFGTTFTVTLPTRPGRHER